MRRTNSRHSLDFRILIVDDEIGIIDSLSVVLRRNGYELVGLTDPLEAVERVRKEHFDLLILDYIMQPTHGDKVVEMIRQFNNDIYILLLTGHKDLAPPLETLRSLDIQGYCEKSDKFDQLLLLVESGIKSITMMHTIKKFKDGLNRILEAVPKIYQLQPIDNILEGILVELMPFVHSESAFILVDDTANFAISNHESIFKGIGKYNVKIDEFITKLEPVLMENIGFARTNKQVLKLDGGVIFPLVNDIGEVIGVLFVESCDYQDGIRLLEIYANLAASSINNAFLHSLVNMKNDELNQTYNELKMRYLDTIEALRLTVDARDVYTRGHSDRVAYYAVETGKAFGLRNDQLEILRIGGIFHDIGKISTADDILLKTDKLDEKEYIEVKKHPVKGANILAAISMFKNVVPLVRYHHERIDGKGYPDGLRGEQIPLLARILSVADAFDAMTSDRQYRSKLGLEEAVNQLLDGSGSQFDAVVVDKFLNLLADFTKMERELAYTFE